MLKRYALPPLYLRLLDCTFNSPRLLTNFLLKAYYCLLEASRLADSSSPRLRTYCLLKASYFLLNIAALWWIIRCLHVLQMRCYRHIPRLPSAKTRATRQTSLYTESLDKVVGKHKTCRYDGKQRCIPSMRANHSANRINSAYRTENTRQTTTLDEYARKALG